MLFSFNSNQFNTGEYIFYKTFYFKTIKRFKSLLSYLHVQKNNNYIKINR